MTYGVIAIKRSDCIRRIRPADRAAVKEEEEEEEEEDGQSLR
jgi:hypothetical protein